MMRQTHTSGSTPSLETTWSIRSLILKMQYLSFAANSIN